MSSLSPSDYPGSTLTQGSRDTPLESDPTYQAFLNAAGLSDDQARADAALRSTQAQQGLTTRLGDISRQSGIAHGQLGNNERYRGFADSSSRIALDARNDEEAGRSSEGARTDVANQVAQINSTLNGTLANNQMQRGAQGAQAAARQQASRDAEIQRQQDDQQQAKVAQQQHDDQQRLIAASNAASQAEIARNTPPPDPAIYMQAQQQQQAITNSYLQSQSLAAQLAKMVAPGSGASYLQAKQVEAQIEQEKVNAYLHSLALDALKKSATPSTPYQVSA